jgi:hypothetical protein
MKTSVRKEFSLRLVGLSLVAVLALGAATLSQAQAQSASAPSAPASAKAATVQTVSGPEVPTRKPRSKGLNTGVKVHGHWTIEVRNPNGRLASHTEFENALQPQGQQALAAILWGYTPGDWAIVLDGASGDTQLPCAGQITGGQAPCIIGESGDAFATNCGGGLPAGLSNSQCFPTLTIGDDSSHTGSSLSLGGTVTASATSVVSDVRTYLDVCSFSSTPTACAGGGSAPILEAFEFTAATLPAQGSGSCGGTGQLPCAVNVSAGQTVSVSVVISFQ